MSQVLTDESVEPLQYTDLKTLANDTFRKYVKCPSYIKYAISLMMKTINYLSKGIYSKQIVIFGSTVIWEKVKPLFSCKMPLPNIYMHLKYLYIIATMRFRSHLHLSICTIQELKNRKYNNTIVSARKTALVVLTKNQKCTYWHHWKWHQEKQTLQNFQIHIPSKQFSMPY